MDVGRKARDTGQAGADVAERVDRSAGLDLAVRIGLAAYGVVHLLLAWLALQLVLGQPEGTVSGTGALHELAQQPLGGVLLWLVAAGFAALVAWQALAALVGHTRHQGPMRLALRLGSAVRAVLYGALGWTAASIAAGAGGSRGGGGSRGTGGQQQTTDTYTARLMSWPFGVWLVGLVGVAVIGFAVVLVAVAVSRRYRRHLDSGGTTGRTGQVVDVLARVGYVGRAVAFATVGGLFVWAALTHDPRRSGGLDAALARLLQTPPGPALLVLVAAGFACFGLYCFIWARHLRR